MLSLFVERSSLSQKTLRCGLTIYPYFFYHTLVNYSKPLLYHYNNLVHKALRHP
nr:MAG TPA: hypothetical protein [Caudoviricetes sp.]